MRYAKASLPGLGTHAVDLFFKKTIFHFSLEWRVVFFLFCLTAPAFASDMQVQLINEDPAARLQILLDQKVIYEGKPQVSSNLDQPPLPMDLNIGQLNGKGKHVITALNLENHTKAVFEWGAQQAKTGWLVIRYYPGRAIDREPPFFTFALQSQKVFLK